MTIHLALGSTADSCHTVVGRHENRQASTWPCRLGEPPTTSTSTSGTRPPSTRRSCRSSSALDEHRFAGTHPRVQFSTAVGHDAAAPRPGSRHAVADPRPSVTDQPSNQRSANRRRTSVHCRGCRRSRAWTTRRGRTTYAAASTWSASSRPRPAPPTHCRMHAERPRFSGGTRLRPLGRDLACGPRHLAVRVPAVWSTRPGRR
jgi:hypothetical protein